MTQGYDKQVLRQRDAMESARGQSKERSKEPTSYTHYRGDRENLSLNPVDESTLLNQA